MLSHPKKAQTSRKQGEPQLAVSETVNPPAAPTVTATAAGVGSSLMDATPKRHASPERSTITALCIDALTR